MIMRLTSSRKRRHAHDDQKVKLSGYYGVKRSLR